MSEIFHPPVELYARSPYSPEQKFAHEAFVLLMDYCQPRDEFSDGTHMTLDVTERVDMPSSDARMRVALRLQSLPVVDASNNNPEQHNPSKDYVVVALEHAIFDDMVDFLNDDELTWQSYVIVVANTHDPLDVQVLDAATGSPLSHRDLLKAQTLLRRLHDELRENRYEERDLLNYLGVIYRKISAGQQQYEDFESANFIDTEPCEELCDSQHVSCAHNPYSLN